MKYNKGYSDVLVGLQYGDEGKGKEVDLFAPRYDVVARFNGGANAGHTIEHRGQKIILKQIPSGVNDPEKLLYIGSGCVLNPEKLLEELNQVKAAGLDVKDRLFISDMTTLIQPSHIAFDQLSGKGIGTTGNGIGPAYADQALRKMGDQLVTLRVADALDDLDEAFKVAMANYQRVAPHVSEREMKEEVQRFIDALQTVKQSGYVMRDPLWLDTLVRKGKRILMEGAQATMLDRTHGTVPNVTSSHTLAGGAYTGGDISPRWHRKTMGVAKAIMSRVGNGPFVSELGGIKSEAYCNEEGGKRYTQTEESKLYNPQDLLQSDNLFDVGIAIRMLSNEYGANSLRPRRIGLFDLVQLRHAIRLNGVDELFINKVDDLRLYTRAKVFNGVPLVSTYLQGSVKNNSVPTSEKMHRAVQAKANIFPFEDVDMTGMRHERELPPEVSHLLKAIRQRVGTEIRGIGVGPGREQFIETSSF